MKRCPHCECAIDDNPKGVPRSPEQLRRYFAVLRAFFYFWPEKNDTQFSTFTEFRKWVQIKVGYRTVGAKIPITRMSKEQAMFLAEASIRGAKSYSMCVIHNGELVIFNPSSIAFKNMVHHKFCALNNAVDEFLFNETGMEAEQVLQEYADTGPTPSRSRAESKVSA